MVLLDFGLAIATNLSLAKTFVGTPCYLAPEVELVRSGAGGEYGTAVDVWSMGAVLHVMLIARFPEFDRSGGSPWVRVEGPAWEGVSQEARRIIAKLMDPDPTTRMTAAEVLDDSWMQQESPDARDDVAIEDGLCVSSGASRSVDHTLDTALVAVRRTPLATVHGPGRVQRRRDLYYLHAHIAKLFTEALSIPGTENVHGRIRECALKGRALVQDTAAFLRKLEDAATQIIESSRDVLLAVEESEPKLAHTLFDSHRSWIASIREEMRRTKQQNEVLLEALGALLTHVVSAQVSAQAATAASKAEGALAGSLGPGNAACEGPEPSAPGEVGVLSLMALAVDSSPQTSPQSSPGGSRALVSSHSRRLPVTLGHIDKQLDYSAALWSNIEIVFDRISLKVDLAEAFIDFTQNPRILSQFQSRLQEYSALWFDVRETVRVNAASNTPGSEEMASLYSFTRENPSG